MRDQPNIFAIADATGFPGSMVESAAQFKAEILTKNVLAHLARTYLAIKSL